MINLTVYTAVTCTSGSRKPTESESEVEEKIAVKKPRKKAV